MDKSKDMNARSLSADPMLRYVSLLPVIEDN